MKHEVPTAAATTLTMAALTLKRLARGRVLWVGAIIAALPVMFGALLRARRGPEPAALGDLLWFATLLIAVLPGLFVASSVGEDIEDRTTTYLWSRPVQRGAIVIGKLVAILPILWVLVLASWAASTQVGAQLAPTPNALLAVAGGVTAAAMIAAALATLVPRHGLALTTVYMLFIDFPIGALPASLRYISVSHHVHTIASVRGRAADAPSLAAIALGVICVVWLAIALRRISRLEA
ncbi:MAG: ABC transporter permease [Deltaproteobacteria bacterium]|nr:ABC transporter permease [Deltaproteobacteria bacterium]